MARGTVEFGYYPEPLQLDAGSIHVRTLPRLVSIVRAVERSKEHVAGWGYAPLQQQLRAGTGRLRTLPYSTRVFGLPLTHRLEHSRSSDPERLRFLVQSLGVFVGMRLTADSMAFLDATPLRPGKLNDIVWIGDSLSKALAFADRFWSTNSQKVRMVMSGVIHSFLLGQNPHLLQYERFIYYYTALEGACFVNARGRPAGPHGKRIKQLCRDLGIPLPSWLRKRNAISAVAVRNGTMHEALFLDAPLGFQTFQGYRGRKRNLVALQREAGSILLSMDALICRVIIALFGMRPKHYLRSSVLSRARHGVEL